MVLFRSQLCTRVGSGMCSSAWRHDSGSDGLEGDILDPIYNRCAAGHAAVFFSSNPYPLGIDKMGLLGQW